MRNFISFMPEVCLYSWLHFVRGVLSEYIEDLLLHEHYMDISACTSVKCHLELLKKISLQKTTDCENVNYDNDNYNKNDDDDEDGNGEDDDNDDINNNDNDDDNDDNDNNVNDYNEILVF